jgi:hypothetical protein
VLEERREVAFGIAFTKSQQAAAEMRPLAEPVEA